MTATVPEQVATSHLREAAERLLVARARAASAALVVAEERERFTQDHAEEITLAEQAAAAEQLADHQLRDLTLAYYAATGERKPVPGVEVALRSSFAFNAEAIMAWVKRTGIGLVPERYDEKMIQKVAKAAPGSVEGVTETQEPFVKIASDLSTALYGGAQ
jgi:hypothetical protein